MTAIDIVNGTTAVASDIPATTTYIVEDTGTLEIDELGVVTGATIETGGVLDILAGGTAINTIDDGNLVIDVFGVADGLTINQGATATVEAGATLTGNITAAGTLRTTAGLDNTGAITVSGALAVTGLLQNASLIEIETGATVSVDGTYRQTSPYAGAESTLEFQLQGTQAGLLAITGAADLRQSGGLAIAVPQTPAVGGLLTIIQFTPGSLLGMFTGLSNSSSVGSGTSQTLGNGILAGLLYNDSAGDIQLAYATAPTSTADTWVAGGTADWTVAGGWSNGLPTFYTDATIGADADVSLTTDATMNSLTIDAGATLATDPTDSLSIGRGLTIYGHALLSLDGETTIGESTTTAELDGTIAVAGPLLYIGANITGSGTIDLAPGVTLELDHEIAAASVVFQGPGATFLYDNNPQLFTGTLDGFNAGGILAVDETITGATIATTGSSQTLLLTGTAGTTDTIKLNPHDDFSHTVLQVTVADGLSTIQQLLPAVTAVSEQPATGDLTTGQSDTLTLTMNEPVAVSGTPILTLNDGGTATYDPALSTPTNLVFAYTVGAEDDDVPLLAAYAIALPSGAAITDAVGNPIPTANLSLAALPQQGPAIVTPTTFQQVAAVASGNLMGAYLWSNPANWTNGVPVDGGTAIVPADLQGLDDIGYLSLSALYEYDNSSVVVFQGTLDIGAVVVPQSTDGDGRYLLVDNEDNDSSVASSVTVGTITGNGGVFGAFGGNDLFVDLSPSNSNAAYEVGFGGTVVVSAPLSDISEFTYESTGPIGDAIPSGTIALAHPGAITAAPLQDIAPGYVLELPGHAVIGVDFGTSTLTVVTDIGTYDFSNVTYSTLAGGYAAAFDSATGLEAITFVASTTFQSVAAVASGNHAGAFLWSNPANWTNGIPTDGESATIPADLRGLDDIADLRLAALYEYDNSSVEVFQGILDIGSVVVPQSTDGDGRYLYVDNVENDSSVASSVTVGTITGNGGVFGAFGGNDLFVDLSPSNSNAAYEVGFGGTVVVSAPLSDISEFTYASTGPTGDAIPSGTIALAHPGAITAAPLQDIAPGYVLELPGHAVRGVDFGTNTLTVATDIGTYDFSNVTYSTPANGYTSGFDATNGLEAITFTETTQFQGSTIQPSGGSLSGFYLWSSPDNWPDGVPANGDNIVFPGTAADDVPALTLGTLDLTMAGNLSVTGSVLNVGTVAGGPGSVLFADPVLNATPSTTTVTVNAILGASGTFGATGPRAIFEDLATIDPGETYVVSDDGTVLLAAAPADTSIFDYDQALGDTFAFDDPIQTSAALLEDVAPGDVLELPGTAIDSVSFGSDSLTASTSAGTYGFSNVAYSAPVTAYTASQDAATGLAAIEFACFCPGTRIRTSSGDTAVERLRIGEPVLTASGKTAPIVWIGHRRVDLTRLPEQDRPVRIRANAFGRGRPTRDLLLSPDHALLRHGVLIPVRHLVNGTTIAHQPIDITTYWHVELPAHDVLLAEGLPAESYLDTGNRATFAGRLVPQPEHHGEAIWEAAGYAPLRMAPPARRPTTSDLARLLQPAWYLAANPDVAAAGLAPGRHYVGWGCGEARLPCPEPDLLRGLGLIDPGSLIFTMRDVVAAGVDPVAHFCRTGWREHRRPNPYFDPAWYLASHDVPPDTNPLLHYVLRGEALGLAPSRHFDPAWYRRRHRLRPSVSALAHHLRHRRSGHTSPLPSFDVATYRAAHPGLRPGRDPYAHFLATSHAA